MKGEEALNCTKCGRELVVGAKYCDMCGKRTDEPVDWSMYLNKENRVEDIEEVPHDYSVQVDRLAEEKPRNALKKSNMRKLALVGIVLVVIVAAYVFDIFTNHDGVAVQCAQEAILKELGNADEVDFYVLNGKYDSFDVVDGMAVVYRDKDSHTYMVEGLVDYKDTYGKNTSSYSIRLKITNLLLSKYEVRSIRLNGVTKVFRDGVVESYR